jgi:hypothetical protein
MTQLNHKELVSTARVTGIWYLILAISGMLGFLLFHPQIFIANKPQETLSNLINLKSTATIRLLFEMVLIVSQAVAALYFYKLFKDIKSWAAWGLGVWGTVNAVAIMISAIAMSSAIEIANSTAQTLPERTMMIQLLSGLISNAWGMGNIFFGLWLIPMGYIVVSSKRMPIWLGRILMIGGFGYILSALLKYMGIDAAIADSLAIPATIGEFWMIGYLLSYGIRPEN